MASYINSVLMRDEELIFAARLHWIIYFWGLVITITGWAFSFYGMDRIFGNVANVNLPKWIGQFSSYINLAIVIFGVILLIFAYIRQQTTELAVTNRRVLAKFGVISRTTFELFLDKVEGVNVDQTIMGRMLGYGSIHVKGTGGGMSPIDSIYYPEFFQRVLLEQIRLRHDRNDKGNDD
jgi:uncharacterized membrane protein YdbT with pleckstrin-like domain